MLAKDASTVRADQCRPPDWLRRNNGCILLDFGWYFQSLFGVLDCRNLIGFCWRSTFVLLRPLPKSQRFYTTYSFRLRMRLFKAYWRPRAVDGTESAKWHPPPHFQYFLTGHKASIAVYLLKKNELVWVSSHSTIVPLQDCSHINLKLNLY